MAPIARPQDIDVETLASSTVPTVHGDLRITVFDCFGDDKEHLALSSGVIAGAEDLPVRIHSECLTSEVLGSLKCDCREQLNLALDRIAQQPPGLLLYLRQEGRGIGLANKIRAYALQEQGMDTVEANHALGFANDLRDYSPAATMLRALGVKSVRLMTNNPDKVSKLAEHGVAVNGRIPHEAEPHELNIEYLRTKARKTGHMFTFDDLKAAVGL